ncbi:MAG TPA: hypothetical protein VEB21_13010, partial [Terriglobales bacterium]|nr:hypothetical protein [Terriglobales bacterium]
MASILEYARLSAFVYRVNGGLEPDLKTTVGTDWELFLSPPEGPGYFGSAYFNAVTREVVIVHRGSQITSQSDLSNILETSLGELPSQFSAAQAFYLDVLEELSERGISPSSIAHAGHSLGGALANLMSVTTGQRAVGFNALGVRESLAQFGGDPNADYSDRITNVSSRFDPANSVGSKIGEVRYTLFSSIPFIPDALEPLIALISAKFVGLSAIGAYLYDQHSIDTVVSTLSKLSSAEINSLTPSISLDIDGTVTGPGVSEWSELQQAIDSDPALGQLIADTDFSRDPALSAVQVRSEQQQGDQDGRIVLGTSSKDFIVGVDGRDFLRGGENQDIVFGDEGADILEGGAGDDFLVGGAGHDAYLFLSGEGQDHLSDSDGKGLVVRNASVLALGVEQTNGVWVGDGVTYTRNGADLEITFADNASDKLTLKDFNFAAANADGYVGIRLLKTSKAPVSPVREFFGDKQNWDSDPNESGEQAQVDSFGNVVRADGQGGRPDLAQPDRADAFDGSAADEVERFITAGGDDFIRADGVTSNTSSAGGKDLIDAGAGRDIVAAGGNNDWVEGGAEGDLLGGNAGDDSVYGDSSNGQTLTLAQAIAAGETQARLGDTGDLITADGGNDVVVGAATDDRVYGGLGADVIVGGGGDDNIFGDRGLVSGTLEWTAARQTTVSGGVKFFSYNTAHITEEESNSVGDADVIYGGAGKDWIFAGAGDDYVEGGNSEDDANVDDDVLFGGAGSDIVIGGSGKDHLSGDSASVDAANLSGDDYLDGGAGDDEILGGKGNDILVGGAGIDTLVGGEGDDVYWGGAGDDVIVLGPGKDTFIYERGDGTDVVVNDPSGTGAAYLDSIALGSGISRADVKFRLGSLMIDLGDGDEIHIAGFDHEDPASTRVLSSLRFADGEVMTFDDILDQGFDLDGTDGNDLIYGSGVTDRIDAKEGDDAVVGRAGDDVVLGGGGDDTLDGMDGADNLDGGLGNDQVFGGEGNDTLSGGEGIDFLSGNNGNDVISGGEGVDTLFGGSGDDELSGGTEGDSLWGDFGNDVLDGDAGLDTLRGGTGDDELAGGADDDSLFGDSGLDVLDGGEGHDSLFAGTEN